EVRAGRGQAAEAEAGEGPATGDMPRIRARRALYGRLADPDQPGFPLGRGQRVEGPAQIVDGLDVLQRGLIVEAGRNESPKELHPAEPVFLEEVRQLD